MLNQTKTVQLNDVNAIIYFTHFRDGMHKCLLDLICTRYCTSSVLITVKLVHAVVYVPIDTMQYKSKQSLHCIASDKQQVAEKTITKSVDVINVKKRGLQELQNEKHIVPL